MPAPGSRRPPDGGPFRRIRQARRTLAVACGLLLLAAWSPVLLASGAPQPFTVHYEVRHNSILLARMVRSLRPAADGTFVFESRSTPAGLLSTMRRDLIEERTLWEVVDERPRPIQYQYHHTGRRDERHVVLDFDWTRGLVTNTVNNKPWQMRIPADTQDKLLYQYTMMLDLQAGRQELAYPVADGGELKTYRFEEARREELKTALGRLQTVKLQRFHGDRRIVIWVAPDLGYLPVRIEQHRDRRMVAVTITRIEN